MKKFKKGLVCCILSIALVFTLTGGIAISADDETVASKISDSLRKEMSNSETVQIFVWLEDSIKKEDVQAQVFEELKIGEKEQKIILGEIEEGTVDDDLLDSYIERKNDVYSSLYEANNSKLVNEYFKDEKILFMSTLTPMAVIEVESSKVEKIAQYKDVTFLDLYVYSPGDDADVSVPLIKSNTVNNTYGYTGAGVKIGQVEGGVPNSSVSNVVVRNGSNVTPHATLVAGIISSVAPDAQIYSVSLSSSNITESGPSYIAAIEWLITTHNVNIINSSCTAVTDPRVYTYDSYCLWVEHIAINHNVHIVKSAGNSASTGVTTPGMAFNVITVGNLNDNNSLDYDDHALNPSSSYSTLAYSTKVAHKPDLVAPGTEITYNGITNSGTSFAAPHVTGAIALMCEQKNTLKVQQRAVKAILAATTDADSPHYYRPKGWMPNVTNNYSRYGAGVLNCKNAYTTTLYSRYFNGSLTQSQVASETIKTHTINVTSGMTRIRVALSYLQTVSGYQHNALPSGTALQSLANLNIYVYYGSTLVDYSTCDRGNVEIIDFDPRDYGTGTYTIKVIPEPTSATPNTTYYTVAWW